jgi:hypothetical protein
MDGNCVEILYDLPAHFAESQIIWMLPGYKQTAFICPLSVKSVYRSRFLLIRAHTIDTTHEDISKECAVGGAHEQFGIQMETGIALDPGKIKGDNGNLFHTGFLQGTPDKPDVVRGTASAACLGHDDSNFVQVIFTGKKSIHDLSYNDQRRITCVIIYIFQSHIHCVPVVIVQYFEMVSACLKSGLHDLEMDRRHLRAEDGIFFAHFLGKRYLCDGA